MDGYTFTLTVKFVYNSLIASDCVYPLCPTVKASPPLKQWCIRSTIVVMMDEMNQHRRDEKSVKESD